MAANLKYEDRFRVNRLKQVTTSTSTELPMLHCDPKAPCPSVKEDINIFENSETKMVKKARKRRKWKKPKGKPKRPLSAYNIFFALERQNLQRSCLLSGGPSKKPPMGFAGLARTIAAKWKSLDAEEKVDFEEKAQIEQERYKKELHLWKSMQEQRKNPCDIKNNQNKVTELANEGVHDLTNMPKLYEHQVNSDCRRTQRTGEGNGVLSTNIQRQQIIAENNLDCTDSLVFPSADLRPSMFSGTQLRRDYVIGANHEHRMNGATHSITTAPVEPFGRTSVLTSHSPAATSSFFHLISQLDDESCDFLSSLSQRQ